ncbi:hypothetical protein BDR26DRAFT_862306 [Obelidium mucronatum]|nr:hypothetical protein BDR26DRAFT_862306 [Obelidium mucronatum]
MKSQWDRAKVKNSANLQSNSDGKDRPKSPGISLSVDTLNLNTSTPSLRSSTATNASNFESSTYSTNTLSPGTLSASTTQLFSNRDSRISTKTTPTTPSKDADGVILSGSNTIRESCSSSQSCPVEDATPKTKLFELPEGWETEEFDPKYEMWRKAMLEALLSDNGDDEEYPLLIPPDLALLISEEDIPST